MIYNLRFIEREVPLTPHSVQKVKVLQKLVRCSDWSKEGGMRESIEWVDVELTTELGEHK